MIDPTGG